MRIAPSGPAAYASVRPSGASTGSTSSPASSVILRVAPNVGSAGAAVQRRVATAPNTSAAATATSTHAGRTPTRIGTGRACRTLGNGARSTAGAGVAAGTGVSIG